MPLADRGFVSPKEGVSAHFSEGQSKARCEAIVRGFNSESRRLLPPGPGASELTTPNLLLPRVPKPRRVLRSPSPHHSPKVQFSHSCPRSFTELTEAHCVPALCLGHSRDRGSSPPGPEVRGQDLTPGREHRSAQMMN